MEASTDIKLEKTIKELKRETVGRKRAAKIGRLFSVGKEFCIGYKDKLEFIP